MENVRIGLVRITEGAILLLSMAFTSIAIYSIFSRYIFNFSLTWIEEVVRFILAWIVFLGMSVLLYHRGHMAMEAILNALPPLAGLAIRTTFDLLMLCFVGIMLVEGYGLAASAMYQISPVTGISYFWPYLSVPIGALLAIVQVVFLLAGDLRELLRMRHGAGIRDHN